MLNVTGVTIISSQRYRDPEIVSRKAQDGDYVVTLGREFELDGTLYRVLVDGHHSYEAATCDGVTPEYREASRQDSDIEGIDDLDAYLEAHWIDSEYYDVATGVSVF